MTTNSSLSVLNVCTQRHAANIRCIALAGAIPEPRRLTPAAPDRMRVCASQKSLFVGRRAHSEARAGGVSPPWGAFDANAKYGIRCIAIADAVY
jgi:hypothetical protein